MDRWKKRNRNGGFGHYQKTTQARLFLGSLAFYYQKGKSRLLFSKNYKRGVPISRTRLPHGKLSPKKLQKLQDPYFEGPLRKPCRGGFLKPRIGTPVRPPCNIVGVKCEGALKSSTFKVEIIETQTQPVEPWGMS
jgi:hypothetical protein